MRYTFTHETLTGATPKQRLVGSAYLRLPEAKRSAGAVAKKLDDDPGTVRQVLRRLSKLAKSPADENECIGIIGDTHLPFEREGYLEFCRDTFKREGVTRVIHIGDLVDHHALSFHESEPGLKGANGEYFDARDRLKPWFEAFPKLTLVHGNHDLIPARQVKKIGIDPDIYMRPISEVYGFPPGWDVVEKIIIDGVVYHHGKTSTGVNGFRNDAIKRMQCSVSGHNHGNWGISGTSSDHRMVWGMAVGCGVDSTLLAFVYGADFALKPIVGCGVVKKHGTEPHVFKMELGER